MKKVFYFMFLLLLSSSLFAQNTVINNAASYTNPEAAQIKGNDNEAVAERSSSACSNYVYDQDLALNNFSSVGYGISQNFGPNWSGADDFILSSNVSIGSVTISIIDFNSAPVPPETYVTFRADNGGSPGSILSTQTVPQGVSTYAPHTYPSPLFYEMNIPLTPVNLNAGTYWLEISTAPVNIGIFWQTITTITGANAIWYRPSPTTLPYDFSFALCASECPDPDNDSVCDDDDNCPNEYNPGQEDLDNDGIGDACDPCNNYVIISEENMEIEETTVHSGGIGVLNEDEVAKIDDNSMVTAIGTWVKAPEVEVKDGSEVTTIFEEQATPCMPEFLYNDYDSNNDVDVDEDEIVILNEAIYDDIEVEDGATVIFSGHQDVYIEDFETGENVTVIFDQCTRLIVEKEFRLGEESDFNTTNESVAVYAEDKIAFEGRNTAYGLFYTLEEIIVHKAKSYDRNKLHGQFIGREVDAAKYTDFYYQPYMPCNNPAPYMNLEQEDIVALEHTLDDPSKPKGSTPSDFDNANTFADNISKLSVAPNPFNTTTNIGFTLAQEDQVVIEIYNLNGQLVNELSAGTQSSGTHKLKWNGDSKDGSMLGNGIYIIVLKSSEQVITKKVSLVR